MRPSERGTGRGRCIEAAFGTLVGVLLVLATTSPGVSGAEPAPITDYASFPAPLPAGCALEGPAVVPGVQFAVSGRTGADLSSLPIVAGDTVTMTWPAFAPGCETLGIGLSVKISHATAFDIDDDQYLQSFAYCGPEGPACASPASISIQVPSASSVPCFQLDAHIGPPLALVGPAGAYYGSGLAPHTDMLISAFNGGTGSCATPPCATAPEIPAAALLCTVRATSSTVPSTTPPTTPSTTPSTAPSTAVPVTSTTVAATTATAAAGAGAGCVEPTAAAATSATVAASSNGSSDGSSSGSDGTSCQAPCGPELEADAAGGECLAAPAGEVSAGDSTEGDATDGDASGSDASASDASAGSVGRQAAIPLTGSRSQPLVLLAGILLVVGAPLALVFRRPGTRRSQA